MSGAWARAIGPETISNRVSVKKRTAGITRVEDRLLSKNMRVESPLWNIQVGKARALYNTERIDPNRPTVYHPLFAPRPCSTKPSPTTASSASLAAAAWGSSTRLKTPSLLAASHLISNQKAPTEIYKPSN